MDIGARPHIYGVFLMFCMFVLTLADTLCFDWLYILSCVGGIGTSFIDWAQMSRFHLKAAIESSLRNVMKRPETH
jgi:hypothetical protein